MPARSDTVQSVGRWIGPAVFVAALLALALRGGSYDVIARSEAAILLWWGIGLVVALGLGRPRRIGWGPLSAAGLLLALGVWMAVSLRWTESDERTWAEMARVVGYAGVPLLVGLVVGRRNWRLAAGAVPFVVLLVCGLAVLSRLSPDTLSSDLSQTIYGGRRLDYPFNYWNSVGAWGAMGVALSLAWSAHATRWWTRSAALAMLPVAALVAYLPYSRSAAIGVTVGVVVALALARHRWVVALHGLAGGLGALLAISTVRGQMEIAEATGTAGAGRVALVLLLAGVALSLVAFATMALRLDRFRLPVRVARAGAVAAAVCVLVATGVAGPAVADRAWESFRTPTPAAGSDPAARLTSLGGTRSQLWAAAADGFAARPWQGSGAGTFEFTWNRSPERVGESVRDAHNLYLETLSETGVPGAALLILALVALLAAAVQARVKLARYDRAGLVGGLVAAFAVFGVTAGADWMWESTALAVVALAAVTLAAASLPRAPTRMPRGRAVGLVLLALVAIAIQLPALASVDQLRSSQRAAAEGRFPAALASASAAVQTQPWAASPYLQRALVLELQGSYREAVVDARRAAEREPTNWRTWLVVARSEARSGNFRRAISAALEARSLNPKSPLFRRSHRKRR